MNDRSRPRTPTCPLVRRAPWIALGLTAVLVLPAGAQPPATPAAVPATATAPAATPPGASAPAAKTPAPESPTPESPAGESSARVTSAAEVPTPGMTSSAAAAPKNEAELLAARPSSHTNGMVLSESHAGARQTLMASLFIFLLAVFVGFEVIAKVPPTLHTPLMSGSNAISGITIVGALLVASYGFHFSSFVGFLAVILATVNVVGGFAVTHRMLVMFKRK